MKPKIKEFFFPAIVVGAGAAGMMSASELSQKGVRVACISKVFPTRSHTGAAQGGIAASFDEDDREDWHFWDTVSGGCWLGDQTAIMFMCRKAKEIITLLENFGTPFSRRSDGLLDQRKFGGATKKFGMGGPSKRVCFVADKTGHAILQTLYHQCLKNGVHFFSEYVVFDLVMDGDICHGVVGWDLSAGELCVFWASATIFATGGGSKIYKNSTNADICTGDGFGLALRAGLFLQDMEFTQFHPTGLYGCGYLISEASRGEGGYLLNKYGERFVGKYSNMQELAPRDVVSRAIVSEIKNGNGCGENGDYVELSLSHLDPQILHERLPEVLDIAKTFGDIDPLVQNIPVAPSAHYSMGGIPTLMDGTVIKVGSNGELKQIQGLFAIGETACISVHGANRLGGNSLLETVVFGHLTAEKVSQIATEPETYKNGSSDLVVPLIENFHQLLKKNGEHSPFDLKIALQETMWLLAGVVRNQQDLLQAKEQINSLFCLFNDDLKIVDNGLIWNSSMMAALEVRNMLYQAFATVHCAINRRESRGAHFREDFPATDYDDWNVHSLISFFDDLQPIIRYRAVDMSLLSRVRI